MRDSGTGYAYPDGKGDCGGTCPGDATETCETDTEWVWIGPPLFVVDRYYSECK
jgi:hypothetical protein